jgi:hypothetical protein
MKSNGRSTAGSLLDRDPNAAYIPDAGVKLVEFRASHKWRNHIAGELHFPIGKVHDRGGLQSHLKTLLSLLRE